MGVRMILLLGAVIVFVVAIFVDKDQVKWLCAGLALFAGAFLLSELAGGGFGKGLRRRL
jgi:ABC-type transport system involved in cytochrome c biogenesis permease component